MTKGWMKRNKLKITSIIWWFISPRVSFRHPPPYRELETVVDVNFPLLLLFEQFLLISNVDAFPIPLPLAFVFVIHPQSDRKMVMFEVLSKVFRDVEYDDVNHLKRIQREPILLLPGM